MQLTRMDTARPTTYPIRWLSGASLFGLGEAVLDFNGIAAQIHENTIDLDMIFQRGMFLFHVLIRLLMQP